MASYYDQIEYMSNSDLQALDDLMRGIEPMQGLQKIYDFGNLVDTLITGYESVNHLTKSISEPHSGRTLTFQTEEFEHGLLMKKAFDAHPIAPTLFKGMSYQKEIYRKRFPIIFEGRVIHVRARCKFDGLNKAFSLGGDIKTTAAKTEPQFLDAFYHFNYDRQAAWYMDLAGIDRMTYVGISKKAIFNGLPVIFIHSIKRDDPCYKSGLAKYQNLAPKYYFMIQQFNLAA